MNPVSSSSEPTKSTQTNPSKPKSIPITEVEVIGEKIIFFGTSGFPKKLRVASKEIPIHEITNIESLGHELKVTWKGITYTFLAKKKLELLNKLQDEVKTVIQARQNSLENNDKAIFRNTELSGIIYSSIDIIDLLFDTLIALQEKQINWQNLETSYCFLEEMNNSARQTISPLNLNFQKVSSAIKKQSSEDTSRETYEILKTIFGYFSRLYRNCDSKECFRDFQNANELVLAYLLLNELLLGKVVGDKEDIGEILQLESALQNLSIDANFKINIEELKVCIGRIGLESDNKSNIKQTRDLFKKQLIQLTEQIVPKEEPLEIFIKEQLPTAKSEKLEIVPELKKKKRPRYPISVTPVLSKLKHFLAAGPLWYWFTISFSIIIGLVVFLVPTDVYPWSLIRNLFGLILVYWLPGFAFVKAVFPNNVPVKIQFSSLEAIERLALSIGVSIALTPIIGLIFYYTPLGVNTPFIKLSLILLTMVFATLAVFREFRKKTISSKVLYYRS